MGMLGNGDWTDEDSNSFNYTRKSEDYDPVIVQRIERDIGLIDSKLNELDNRISLIDENLSKIVKVLDKFMKKLERE